LRNNFIGDDTVTSILPLFYLETIKLVMLVK